MASILKVNEIQNASGTSALSVDLSGNAAFTGDVQADGVYNQSGDSDSGLDLSTNDVVAVKTGNTERMRVDNAGNVGIGTNAPSQQLHLSGSTPIIRLTDTDTSAYGEISSSSSDGNLMFFADQGNTQANTTMRFYVDASERMRIDSSGRFMVAQTSLVANGQFEVSSTSGHVSSFNANSIYHHLARFQYASTTNVGSITTNGSSTAYNTTSDYRLKTDAQPMTGASARVQALNPVNFEWISTGERVDGFLAHEAQEVVPEAVVGTKDAVDEDGNPEYQGIDQSKLVPLLTAALQEALTEIADLKARVAALETPA